MFARSRLGQLLAAVARHEPGPEKSGEKDKGGKRPYPKFRDYLKQIKLAETAAKEAQRIGTLPDRMVIALPLLVG